MEQEKAKNEKKNVCQEIWPKILEVSFTVASCSEYSSLPLCLLCSQVLSNGAMKPCTHESHLNSKHVALANKSLAYFERLFGEMKSKNLK